MECPSRVSKPCAWIDGEATVKNLITDLGNKLVTAKIPLLDGGNEPSKWEILYKEREHNYVTYEPYTQIVNGRYIHEDGNEYEVMKIPDYTKDIFTDDSGYLNEITNNAPYDKSNYEGYYTGKKINTAGFDYDGVHYEIPNALVVLIDVQPNLLEKDLENPWEKYQAYMVKHVRESVYSGEVEDKEWNYYKIVAPMPDDWTYNLWRNGFVYSRYSEYHNDEVYHYSRMASTQDYRLQHTYFYTEYHEVSEKLVLECNTTDNKKYNVYFEKPLDSNNYIRAQYGVDIKYQKNLKDIPENSYLLACDLDTIGAGKKPQIINELEAYKAFERQLNKEYEQGELELGGTMSPISNWFFSENSTEKWMIPNMRGKESVVRYWISFNNDRALIILEGDPNFEFESFYRMTQIQN